ncbi:hypothetical protein L1987_39770 [Smallanthus sonchifolius]|uniref:Uncharacterized protein n=1 Tax=Smallanthus sonchifolius TaxID=185202 RepID=A0ACB9HMC2_9ASTR|nr:hypothetical protein L1987_39770 [Smallanthus sonchifolius]
MWKCNRIKYLFSPLMVKLLSNLKTISIDSCDAIEEVVSNRDDKHEEEMTTSTTTFFPHLHSLSFYFLKNLKRIGGASAAKSTTSIIHDQFKSSHVTVVPWSLCQYSREIFIYQCDSLMEVFETQEINNSSDGDITSTTIPRRESIYVPRLFNLKKLIITLCDLLQHVFTFSTLESLEQLEKLMVKNCKAMKVIVKEENGEQINKVVKFPRLKSLEL